MKLLVVAGGGGHFAPALAVIEALPRDWGLLVIGRKYTFEGDKSFSLEYQTAKNKNIPFVSITTGRLQRTFTRHTIKSLFKIPGGFFQALQIIKKFKPDVLISFGGYVSVPVIFAAHFLRIPIIVHEQTLSIGLSNKIAIPFAKKICLSWRQSQKYFPLSKVVVTGNPLRKTFLKKADEDLPIHTSLPIIYITGGSSGSHAFNVLVEGCLERLLRKYIIIHQTGDAKEFNDFDRLQKLKETQAEELQERYILTKFVESAKVIDFLKQADLIVSRSGINTLTEILYLGKPCFLIPLPYGQHNEQQKNAMFVKETGLAEVIEQFLLTPDSFYTMIVSMINNLNQYKKHANEARKLIDIHASEKIREVIVHVYKKTNSTKA
jgi:UDP-N-acetylglucosamine--N-acetylmuramyl-(pentapeptide) pyrophosphoryl-undecaprenol N-acetylglucosamine transferase